MVTIPFTAVWVGEQLAQVTNCLQIGLTFPLGSPGGCARNAAQDAFRRLSRPARLREG